MFGFESNLSQLNGKTIVGVEESGDYFRLTCSDGTRYESYHLQDCCETVKIHDVKGGTLETLIGETIKSADQCEDSYWPDDVTVNQMDDSFTWTTQTFTTVSEKTIVVRWLGESNGYYSERVHFKIC